MRTIHITAFILLPLNTFFFTASLIIHDFYEKRWGLKEKLNEFKI